MTFKTIDLFAGIGGIRLGFEEAGFLTVYSNDAEEACKKTFDANFNHAKLHVSKIENVNVDEIPDGDVLLGGFPCQPFSIAGYRKGFKDEGRGDLFFEILKLLKAKNPKAFLLENVKNLFSHDKGETYQYMKKLLEKEGYHVKEKVMNSMKYGNIPQNRERIYIVGFKDIKSFDAFIFPDEIKLTNTLKNVLEKKVDKKYYYTDKLLHDKLVPFVKNKDTVYQWRRVYVRENKAGVSPTLTANMGTGGHNVPIILDNKGIRKLTPRECFRLQGFPENYILPEIADSKLYKQAGNSVSVPVIHRIALNMKTALQSN